MEAGSPGQASDGKGLSLAPLPRMDFVKLPKEAWHEFLDGLTRVVRGMRIEIDVMGLDVGDETETEWAALTGITYEPKEDVLYVYLDRDSGPFEHAIHHPTQLFVQLDGSSINQMVVFDADEHEQFLRLRDALKLPAPAGMEGIEGDTAAP